MSRMAVALAAATLTITAAASAETAFEMAFRTGSLDAFETGDRLDYASAVSMPGSGQGEAAGEAGNADGDTTVSIELADGGLAALGEQRGGTGPARILGQFDASVGNPLGMYFLERTIRSVAQATGGSDYYLRNRIKDALRAPEAMRPVAVDWHGTPVDATEIVLVPFAGDPNLGRMGPFGDLRISLVVGEGIPGWYHTLRAELGDGAFASVLTLAEVVE